MDTKQFHKVDRSSQKGEILKSEIDGPVQVHKLDGSSWEDENLKPKMNKHKTIPQSRRRIYDDNYNHIKKKMDG